MQTKWTLGRFMNHVGALDRIEMRFAGMMRFPNDNH